MDTWWIDEPWLLGSSNPSQSEVNDLSRQGFTLILSLLEESTQRPQYDVTALKPLGVTRVNIPVHDFHAPTAEQLSTFVEVLRAREPGTKVVVHCEGGTGRTGTFAAAYWVAHGLSSADAVAKVRAVREHAIETPEQRQAIEEFAQNSE